MKKGRRYVKPLLTTQELKAAGYIYKMEVLTPEEMFKKVRAANISDATRASIMTVDFDYFYKQIGETELRIYHAGGTFYFNGVRINNKAQIPLLEKKAKDNNKWETAIGGLEDTEINEVSTVPTDKLPDMITLIGGHFDGQSFVYNKSLPNCMRQFKDGKITKSHIYVQHETDPFTYIFNREVI